MNLKKALLTLCATVALLAAPQAMDAAIFQPERNPFGQPITVHANGRYIVSDTQPVLQNNRVLLPMRAAAEAIGPLLNGTAITIASPSKKTATPPASMLGTTPIP